MIERVCFRRTCGVLVASIGAFLCLSLFAAPTNLKPATDEANPIPLLTDTQRSYLYVSNVNERCEAAAEAEKIGRDSAGAKLFCFGSPVTLSWEGTTDACTVSVKRLSDGKVVLKEPTGETSLTIYNLEIGAQYEWTVTCGEESASATFWTSNEAPRLIRSGQMRMMRDLGGWTGTLDGKQYRIRQNLIFRGAAADCPNPDEYLADDTARAFFKNIVGLRNEVDFRNLKSTSDVSSGAKSTGMYKLDPKEEYGIAYNNFYFDAGSSLPTSGAFPEAVRFLTNPNNLPAYFHCKAGRDRTGMMAGFLLAVLGVSEEDILRDYQTTSDKNYYETHGFKTFLGTTLPNYKSSQLSLAENAKAYLIDRGLTDEQVEDFRKTMLNRYGEPPEPPEPEWWIEEPVYVTATRVTFAAGEQTGEQYRGFLTKKGLEYAWGKDGVLLTDWVRGDGTPCDLKKPSDDCELMVR